MLIALIQLTVACEVCERESDSEIERERERERERRGEREREAFIDNQEVTEGRQTQRTISATHSSLGDGLKGS